MMNEDNFNTNEAPMGFILLAATLTLRASCPLVENHLSDRHFGRHSLKRNKNVDTISVDQITRSSQCQPNTVSAKCFSVKWF